MHKALLKSAMCNKENNPAAQNIATDVSKPTKEAIRKPLAPSLAKKPQATIPITPNVLKKRMTTYRTTYNGKKELEPYVFKAKPAPKQPPPNNGNPPILLPRPRLPPKTRSNPDLEGMVKQLDKCRLSQPTLKRSTRDNVDLQKKPTATVRPSRLEAKNKKNEVPPLRRSKSVPIRPVAPRVTVPQTPNVLKRNPRRATTRGDLPNAKSEVNLFRAKPAEVLQRQPFRPTLSHVAPSTQQLKPFQLNLERRLKTRKAFDSKTTDAFYKRNQQVGIC